MHRRACGLLGLKAHVSAITERAMRGEIAFEPALRERVALLKGLSVTVIDEVSQAYRADARRAISGQHHAQARRAYLPRIRRLHAVHEPIGEMIGFDETRANMLLVEGGKLDRRVEEPILGREAKLDTLLELSRHLDLPLEKTLAVGDGANDLAMIERGRSWRRLSRQA